MATQTDNPTATGFLCHICVWRERAESHELMDFEGLVGHGQRYHYLQPNQISDYLKAAYCVTRDPKLIIGSGKVHFERIHRRIKSIGGTEASSFREVRIVENVKGDRKDAPSSAVLSAWKQRNILDTKTNKSFDSAEFHHDRRHSSGIATSAMSSEGHATQQSFTISPVSQVTSLSDSDVQTLDLPSFPSASFASSKSGSLGASFGAEGFSNSNASGELLDIDDIALSTFDYELACLPYFDTQLQEYMEIYGMSEDDMYLGLSLDHGGKMQKWEGDRLQVWPEKVVLELGNGDCVKIEEQEENIWVPMFDFGFDENVGEAAEHIAMREFGGHI